MQSPRPPQADATSLPALLRLLRAVDEHHPSLAELQVMTGASPASLKRAFALLRSVGAAVVPVRDRQQRVHYEVRAWGVFTRDGVLAHVEREMMPRELAA